MNQNVNPLPGAWLVVALLWFVAGLNYLDRMMITTMHGSLVEAIPMTEAQFGLLTSVFLWVYGVASPCAGFLADRFSRSRIIIGSLLVWSSVTWLTGHAKTYEQLLLARGLMGISEATYIPAALSLISDYHRGTTRSLATGIHMTGVFVGAGLGGLGGLLAEHFEWNFAFQLFGAVGIVYSVILAALLRDAPRDHSEAQSISVVQEPRFLDALACLLRSRTYLLLLAFWGLLGLSGWAINGWMPTYLNEQFQLSQGAAGMSATGYIQSAALVGVLVGGAWADFWSRGNSRARIFVCVIGLCAAAPGVLLAAGSNILGLALAGLVLFGLCKSFTDANMMPILCQVSDPRYRATGYGILNMCNVLIGGLAIYVGGILRDLQINVSYVFVFAAGSLIVCAILLLLVRPSPTATVGESIDGEHAVLQLPLVTKTS